ncbi:kelch-like protein 18 [Arctopsyche grandis]|uniref:kelch-like protein 18 n=1 Tax=Arctopsyche grandis TaxID=121162 RepID=UPI00406D954D
MNNEISETFINPEYGGSELSIMYEFYEQGTLCDVTIFAGEERFYTHRLVLAISCKYFRDQIIENPDIIDFEIAVDDETFQKILKFFYKGNIQLDLDSVQRLILAAELLELNVLFDVCCKFLAKHLSADNISDIQTFAETNSLNYLIDEVNKYDEQEISDEISGEENCLQLELEDIVNRLQTSKENISSTDSFEEVVQWISDDSERKQHLPSLLKLMDMTSMSFSVYKSIKITNEIVSPPKTHKIMVVGGKHDPIASYVDVYDPDTESWLETKVMNLKRTDFGVVQLQNYIIVIGGKRARKALNEVVGVHLDTMEASALLPMETNRKHLCVSSILDQDRVIR